LIGYGQTSQDPQHQDTDLPNPLLLFSAQLIAILSVLLLAVGFLKTEPKADSARVFAVLAIFIVFYLLNGMAGEQIEPRFRLDLSAWQLIIQPGVSAIPGLFMLYCFLIFQEQKKFPITLAVAFALQVSLDFVLTILNSAEAAALSSPTIGLLASALDILMLVFVGFAIYWTLKGWRADLVDDRRVFRWFIIGVQGALILAVVFLENFLLDGGSNPYAAERALIVYAIATLALGMVLVAMRFDYVSLGAVIRKVAELREEPGPGSAREFDIESFDQAFREGQLYREAGLTISMLAKKLKLPEYRLRAFIHKQLGFRNFNAMLHQYRIEDAGEVLSDRASMNLPVLTVALSVGYQSITPFNNAFRQLKGVTPSEFRKRRAQD
jgi:AraC-like DNA-binding protein